MNASVPDEVLVQESRYRLCARAVEMNEGGMTQQQVADKLGYSLNHTAERLIKRGRSNRDARMVSPLTAWLAGPVEYVTDAPAPEIEAGDPEVVAEPEGAVIMVGNVALTSMLRTPRTWLLTLDGNDLTLADAPAVPAPTPPTPGDIALFETIRDRAAMLGDAVRMLQHAAGIPATGCVDDATMDVVAGLSAWQDMRA